MKTPPPWEYLGDCSETSLQNFMLAQLNLAASLRKSITADTDKLNESLALAEVARIFIEENDALVRIASLRQGVLDFPGRRKELRPILNKAM